MNVTCPACSSRYAIPDARIAGRRARLKCKRCGELIPVDGRELPAPAGAASASSSVPPSGGGRPASSRPRPPPPPSLPAPRAPGQPPPAPRSPAPPAGPLWTLAEPSGEKRELDTQGLLELYRRGTVEPGALIWRPGMDRWLPPYDVPEVAAALARAGVSVPGSDLEASFEDDEEATRVALSPLLAKGGAGPLGATAIGGEDDGGFSDEEEVTRALDSSTLAAARPLLTDPVPPPAASDEPPEEPTRIFESPRSSPYAQGVPLEQDDETTRIYEGPSQPAASSTPVVPPDRLDPAFLGSTTPPPDELPPRFNAQSILSVPAPDETSDVSGIDVALPQASASWGAGAPKKRSFAWLWVLVLLVVGAAVAAWQRPDWVELVRTQVLTWLGRAPRAEASSTEPPAFDTERVGVVLEEAARTAQQCKLPDGPTGAGRVHVKYVNSGRAESAQVSEPFLGTEVGECLVALFTGTRVPPFSGKPVIVAKNFTIE